MNEEMTIINSCENCKHFRPHYVKRSDRFSATGFGQCVCGTQLKRNLPYRKTVNCALWELAEEEQKSETTIKKLLEEIEEKLKNIKYLLTCKEE